MRISNHYGINFKAQFLTDANIKQYDENKGKYNDLSASFVEINPNDINDRKAVKDAVKYWENDLYGMNIAYSAEQISKSLEEKPSDKIYVITTQRKNFDKLNPDEIKALTHVFETKKEVTVKHLQVNPDLIYTLEPPEYKHVGKSMIDGLKKIYYDRAITLIATKSATKFYEKQGFEHVKDTENRLTWNKQATDDIKYKDEYW